MEKIVIELDVNSDKGIKEVDALNKSLKKTNESQNNISKATDNVSKATKKSTTSSQKNAAAFEAVNKATGGAIRGFRSLIKQMFLLVANPIGATIAALALGLTALYKAFTSTKAGGEQLEQVMAGIGVVIDVLRDRVLKVGEALLKFFTGDFKGALKAGKESVSGFGEEIAKEFKQASDSIKSLQEVEDALRGLSVSRAKLNRDLVQAKEIIEGSTATYLEKKKAIDEVRIAETKQTEEELKNAKKKLDAILVANSLSDSGSADLEKEAQARIAVINLEAISSSNKTKFNKLEEKAQNDELSRIKSISDEKKKAIDLENAEIKKKEDEAIKLAETEAKTELERLNKIAQIQDDFKKAREDKLAETNLQKIELDKERKLIELDELGADEEAKANVLKFYAEKIAEENANITKKSEEQNILDAKAFSDAKIEIAKREQEAKSASLNGYASALGSISSVVGQETEKGKALAIASSLVNTYAAITGQLKAFSGIPVPGFAIAQAIATGVAGFANIKKIAKVKVPNSSGGGSTPSLGGGSTPVESLPPAFNVVGQSDTNQLADAIGGQSKTPQRAYVVASDVTTGQEMDRNIVRSASI